MSAISVMAIEAVPFSAPLTIPVRYGNIERKRSASVLVRLRADNGLVGYGEACCVPQLTGESAESVVALIDLYLRQIIPGTSAMQWRQTIAGIRRRFPKSFVALSAVETAMVDLAGKILGVSASHLLGGRYREEIELCAEISWDKSAQAMADECVQKGAERSILKIFVGPDAVAGDLHRLEIVRKAVGDKPRIMLDVKGLWTTQDAVTVGRILAQLGVFLVEQPITPKDRAGAALVTRLYRDRYGILTAADEAVETPEDVLHAAKEQTFSSINIGVTKMGGPEIAMRAGQMSQAAGLPVLMGSFAELGIATAAGLHLAAAQPALIASSYLGGPERYTQTITSPNLIAKNGYVVVPSGPGLGVEVDEERIANMAKQS